MNERTGRQIAIFTDVHGILEPLEAALQDMEARGITEIYSLGDNIGDGPNPSEVLELLSQYNVQTIAGNSEDYISLGTEPFSYLHHNPGRMENYRWTLNRLNEKQIGEIKLLPHSIELLMGGKKLVLCHFANDIRFDYQRNSTWSYQSAYEEKRNYNMNTIPAEQFLYTNSNEQKIWMDSIITRYGDSHPFVKAIKAASQEPLFSGKTVEYFDAVIQGHVHWKIYDKMNNTEFYSIRALGMAYANQGLGYNNPIDTASYIILHEKKEGFEVEEVLVRYDRAKMIKSIISSSLPDKSSIRRFTSIR